MFCKYLKIRLSLFPKFNCSTQEVLIISGLTVCFALMYFKVSGRYYPNTSKPGWYYRLVESNQVQCWFSALSLKALKRWSHGSSSDSLHFWTPSHWSWKPTVAKVLFKTLRSLQQRDCCRISRHSLLFAFHIVRNSEPMQMKRYTKIIWFGNKTSTWTWLELKTPECRTHPIKLSFISGFVLCIKSI